MVFPILVGVLVEGVRVGGSPTAATVGYDAFSEQYHLWDVFVSGGCDCHMLLFQPLLTERFSRVSKRSSTFHLPGTPLSDRIVPRGTFWSNRTFILVVP